MAKKKPVPAPPPPAPEPSSVVASSQMPQTQLTQIPDTSTTQTQGAAQTAPYHPAFFSSGSGSAQQYQYIPQTTYAELYSQQIQQGTQTSAATGSSAG